MLIVNVPFWVIAWFLFDFIPLPYGLLVLFPMFGVQYWLNTHIDWEYFKERNEN